MAAVDYHYQWQGGPNGYAHGADFRNASGAQVGQQTGYSTPTSYGASTGYGGSTSSTNHLSSGHSGFAYNSSAAYGTGTSTPSGSGATPTTQRQQPAAVGGLVPGVGTRPEDVRIERTGYGTYEGQVKQNKASGAGRFINVNGDIYEGEWFNDRKHGWGIYRNSEGSCYEGQWDEDLKSGKGLETRIDGSTYEGQNWRGKKHGQGVYKSADKTVYEGQFVMDQMDGEGRCTFANGRLFIGQWKQNRMHGEGHMIWPSGQTYRGQYECGKKSGGGTFRWPDGKCYVGEWAEGRQHGKGTYTDPAGRAWTGDWDNGHKVQADPNSSGARAPAKDTLGAGCIVETIADLVPSGWGMSTVRSGAIGRILRIDEKGDARVAFEGIGERTVPAKYVANFRIIRPNNLDSKDVSAALLGYDRKQKSPLQMQIEKGDVSKELLRELGGSRHGIPTGVFKLIENNRLLEGCDLRSAAERNQVVWSMKECAPVFQEEQLELFFIWLASAMLSNRALAESFAQLCSSTAGNALSLSEMQGRPYLLVAWLAQDVLKQWARLEKVDRQFFHDAAPRLMQSSAWSVFTLEEMQSMLDRIQGRWIMIDKSIRYREAQLAMYFLRKTPFQILRMNWETTAADGTATKVTFFDHYESFVTFGFAEAAEDLVDRLVDSFRQMCFDPMEALRSFMTASEDPGRCRRDFLVAFVSSWNIKDNDLSSKGSEKKIKESTSPQSGATSKSGRSLSGMFFPWPKMTKTPSQPALQEEEPSTPRGAPRLSVDFGVVFLELVLNDFALRTRYHSLTNVTCIQEMLEASLLFCSEESVQTWANRVSPGGADVARRLLDTVGYAHIAEVLRMAAGRGLKFEYKEEDIGPVLKGTKKWAHEHTKTRFFFDRDRRTDKVLECVQLLRMYIKLDVALQGTTLGKFGLLLEDDSYLPESQRVEDCMAACINKIAPPSSLARTLICKDLQTVMCPSAMPQEALSKLLSYAGFFDQDFQGFLRDHDAVSSVVASLKTSPDFILLLSAVVKIISIKGVQSKQSSHAVILDVAYMSSVRNITLQFTRKVCAAVLKRGPADFLPEGADGVGFSIASFHECIIRLQLASDVIDFKSRAHNEDHKLIDNVNGVVDMFLAASPCTWETNLGSLDTIVFFLEYMGKEDLGLAYEKLDNDIDRALKEAPNQEEKTKQMQLKSLLKCVKSMYTQPLVTLDVSKIGELRNHDIASAIVNGAKRLEHEVQWCGVTFTPADWEDIVEVAALTAAAMRERFNLLMLPHHTQMITLLMLGIRACANNLKTLPKTMLARVGTGEGKSWIIGMLAAFVVKRGKRLGTGQRAHVVIDNTTLKSRDFDTVSLFFSKLGINASKKEDHLHDPSYQVVYCTGAEIWSQVRLRQELGQLREFEKTLSNVVLILDEVDGLIIDGDANIQYMYPDDTLGSYADHWLRLLENGFNPDEPKTADELFTQELKVAFKKVEDAYYTAKDAEKGRDFEWRGGYMYMVDKSTGMIKVGWWDLWYEIRYWIDTNWQGSVTYKCIKSILCKKHCFTSYSCILGLTGSLGQMAEQDFLSTHYNAVVFNVPYFLDTCRRADGSEQGKPVVKSLNRGDIIQPNEEMQIQAVVNMAAAKCKDVPVLIIAKDQSRLEDVTQRLRDRLGEDVGSVNDASVGGGDRVLKLLQDPGNPERFVKLVDTATQPWAPPGGHPKKGEKMWRISVTTAEGGRGHDYRVVDPAVDEKGGFLLILMWVSWSQREWVQFLGRTARQDHMGQMAVFLNGQSQEVFEVENSGVDVKNGDQVVQAILAAGDEKMKAKCDKVGNHIERGTLMHKQTAMYWKQYNSDESTSTMQENVWRKLCRDYLLDDWSTAAIKRDFNVAFPDYLDTLAPEETLPLASAEPEIPPSPTSLRSPPAATAFESHGFGAKDFARPSPSPQGVSKTMLEKETKVRKAQPLEHLEDIPDDIDLCSAPPMPVGEPEDVRKGSKTKIIDL
eukprot:TRINITY_DN3161_c0_g1_i1.p1 TRINITY_DN3161_c0_g1~~TRINITY_DN3161_c0_g1_i1.p1  ORF type:complete len:1982 (+),score=496.58 TRINITY_DN3161_c0_g1_i1:40-5946(+)